MKKKFKRQIVHKPPNGPTRGKFRQMWKAQMRGMKEEYLNDSPEDFGRYDASLAA